MDREIPQSEIQQRRRLTYFKIGGGVIAAIILIIILAVSLQKTVKRSDITISDVTVGLIEATVNAQGEVVPSFEEIINSPISTRIVEVYKHEGDTVSNGTPLLLLDLQSASTQIDKLLDERQMKHYELEQTRLNNHTYLSNLEMQIQVKEMDVNRKLVEVENERRLDSLGSGTGDRVRQAELAYNTGCLELSQLRQQLVNERSVRDASYRMKELEMSIFEKNLQEQRRIFEDAQIRSPRAATLTYINTNIGQQISSGEKIAVISDLSHFRIDAEIADSYSSLVNPGTKADFRIGRRSFSGRIGNITPQSKNGVTGFTIIPDNQESFFRPGQKAEVFVITSVEEEVVRIPYGPYYKGPDEYELFVLDSDNTLVKRKVALGEGNYQWIKVQSGLKPGDRVVTSDMNAFTKSNKLKIKQ